MSSVRSRLPRGARLSVESLQARHKVNSWLLWLHVPALVLLGLCGPRRRWESAVVPALVAVIGGLSLLQSDPNVKASPRDARHALSEPSIRHGGHVGGGASRAGGSPSDIAAGADRISVRVRSIGAEARSAISAVTAVDEELSTLALNATIEAARAGEPGPGFAVVANEVKELAQQTASSVERVNVVIETIVAQTGEVASTFESTTTAVAGIHAKQIDITASVEEQAAVLDEVTRQLSTATASAQGVLAGLEHLSNDA